MVLEQRTSQREPASLCEAGQVVITIKVALGVSIQQSFSTK